MSRLPEPEYAPLDPDSYHQQALLLRSLHCARPVLANGRREFIQAITSEQAGGRVEMTVYLAGVAPGIDSNLISVEATL